MLTIVFLLAVIGAGTVVFLSVKSFHCVNEYMTILDYRMEQVGTCVKRIERLEDWRTNHIHEHTLEDISHD